VLSTGAVRCWGYGAYGQLGYGNSNSIGDNELPSTAGNVNVGGTVTQIAAGTYHTCAVLSTGAVRCWGYGAYGALGYGNADIIGDNETPDSAGNVDVGGNVTQVGAGQYSTCALLSTGAVRCWGYGYYGQLGYANTNDIGDGETPAFAGDVNVGGTVTQVAVGTQHTCVLLSNGNVRCWGYNPYGELGYGNTTTIGDNETPTSAGNVSLGGTATQVTAGTYHSCALLSTGNAICWGYGPYGSLGYGNTNSVGDTELPSTAGTILLY
jgi:alpha-tubulin suppressor-like RCC1 family protein